MWCAAEPKQVPGDGSIVQTPLLWRPSLNAVWVYPCCDWPLQGERVLFHYNGHGVPRPTANGEVWVFNKSYTQYIPLSIYDLQVGRCKGGQTGEGKGTGCCWGSAGPRSCWKGGQLAHGLPLPALLADMGWHARHLCV